MIVNTNVLTNGSIVLLKSMACNTQNRYGITKEVLRPKVPQRGNANCEKIIFIHFEGQSLL